MKFLLSYLKPHRYTMTAGLVIKFTGTYMDLLIPMILAHIIDDIVPLKSPKDIVLWGTLMIGAAVIALLFNVIANRIASKVAMKTAMEIRRDTFRKVMNLSCSQLDEISIPSAISRLTSDTYELHNFIGVAQRLGVRAPFLLIVGLMMAFTLDWRLALVLTSVVPLLAVIIYFVFSHGIPLFRESRKAGDEMVRAVRENIQGARVIKALSKKDYENKKFTDVNDFVRGKNYHAEKIMSATSPTMNFFLNIGMAMVLLAGSYLVFEGKSTTGSIIAFLSYFTIILNALLSITRVIVRYSRASAAAARITEILNKKPRMQKQETASKEETQNHIEFRDVSFSYESSSPNLNHLSFNLKKGETLGVIGATGSGKSTVINLLLRFYDPTEGEILINGENIRSFDPKELRRRFGTVFQNDFLFSDTIKENISFGRKVSQENIENAASMAQAEEFIEKLPDRFEHQLSIKGNNLSGGQKQRVLLSRAFAADPEFLILDDSSSALDYKTDAKVREELNKNFADTTKIIIAQRITSIMNSDKILVLDEGNNVGLGSHQELLKSCKVYKDIYDVQMGEEGSEENAG